MEGASLHQERGGATVLARYGFNELWSFVAGWAILLDYLILIAITAFATTDYVALFWGELAHGAPELLLAIGDDRLRRAGSTSAAPARGAGSAPRSWSSPTSALQLLIVVLGLALLFEPDVLTDPASLAGTPDAEDVLFAFTIAIAAFSGLDASSALAGEVAVSRRGLQRLFAVRAAAAVPVHRDRARRLLDAAADRRPLVRGADARRRLGVRARRGCASRCATSSRSSRSRCW